MKLSLKSSTTLFFILEIEKNHNLVINKTCKNYRQLEISINEDVHVKANNKKIVQISNDCCTNLKLGYTGRSNGVYHRHWTARIEQVRTDYRN